MRQLLLLMLIFLGPALTCPAQTKCDAPDFHEDGTFLQSCQRSVDTKPCFAMLTAEPEVGEDPAWQACAWPELFIWGGFRATPGLTLWMGHATFVMSFRNSKTADIQLDVEFSDHTHKKFSFTDRPIVLQIVGDDKLAAVTVEFPLPPVRVVAAPVAEVTEKGGSRTMSHTYN